MDQLFAHFSIQLRAVGASCLEYLGLWVRLRALLCSVRCPFPPTCSWYAEKQVRYWFEKLYFASWSFWRFKESLEYSTPHTLDFDLFYSIQNTDMFCFHFFKRSSGTSIRFGSGHQSAGILIVTLGTSSVLWMILRTSWWRSSLTLVRIPSFCLFDSNICFSYCNGCKSDFWLRSQVFYWFSY